MAGISEVTTNSSVLTNMLGSLLPKIDATAGGQTSSFDALIGNNLPTNKIDSSQQPDPAALMSAVDKDGNGTISAEEKQAFEDKFSPDNTASLIQAQEQARAAEQSAATANVPAPDAMIGNNLPINTTDSSQQPDPAALMAAVDKDGNGTISAEEKQAFEDKFSPDNTASLLQAQEQARAAEQSAATANVPAPSSMGS